MEAESKQENKLVETPVQNNEVFNNNEHTDTVEQDKIETPVVTEQKDEPIIINEDTKNAVDELLNGPIKQETQNTRKESHFINI